MLDIQKLFNQERARFALRYPCARDVSLKIVHRHYVGRPAARDFGWYAPGEHRIYLIQRAATLPRPVLQGILQHELGHAVDLQVDSPGAERRADRLAAAVTGRRLRYTADGLQTTGTGRARRPSWLHQ